MENIKVRVNSLLDSNSAQELLVSAGYRRKYNNFTLHNGWVCFDSDNNILCVCSSQAGKELDDYKEITMQELRDMVVLKRNEPDDANFENKVTGIKYFVSSAGDIYFWCGDWQKCHASFRIEKLNSIKEDVMKEYLLKYNDQYTLVELSKEDAESNPERYIEIPDGSEKYIQGVKYPTRFGFVKGDKFWDGEWVDHVDLAHEYNVVWQREKESIIDKLVVGEVDNVNHPSHYASGGIECIDAMIAAYGVEAVKAYCKCNAFKYQWRFDKKNGNEDILKAQWYQNKYMELSNEL